MEAGTWPQPGPNDALLAVDAQRDYCPGGAFGVPEGARPVDEFEGVRALREMRSNGAFLEPHVPHAGG